MPPLQPVVGRAPLYARDPATGDIYEIGGAGASEVAISATDPYATAGATDELWLDTSANPPVLKGRVGGQWVVVSSEPPKPEVIVGGTIPAPSEDAVWVTDTAMVPPSPGAPMKALWVYDSTAGATAGWHPIQLGGSEIEISAVDPITVNPEYELWVDSSVQAPPPVQTDEVWVGPTDPRLAVPPGVQELWLDTSVTPPLLRYWDGTAWVASLYPYLPLAGGTMNSNAVIQFPNEAAPTTKIVMYGTPTSGFGFGVEGGNTTSFGSAFKFRQSSMTGTEFASIDANGVKANGVWVPNLKVINNVALVVGHWYEVSTVNYHRTVRFRIGAIGPGKPTRSQSLDGFAAVLADEGEGASLYSGYLTVYGHLKGKMANNKLFDSIGTGPEKLWIRASQAATVQVGIEAYDTASGGRTTLSFADGGTAPGVWDSVAL